MIADRWRVFSDSENTRFLVVKEILKVRYSKSILCRMRSLQSRVSAFAIAKSYHEKCAEMAYYTECISGKQEKISQYLLDKHYLRKHGINAYYEQSK